MPIAVSTWNQFITALETSGENTIELLADIDCNDNPPTSRISVSGTKIVNGNDHTIYNIGCAQPISGVIFGGNGINFNKCNLYNMNRFENSYIFNSSNTYPCRFIDCKITGGGINGISEYGSYTRCSLSWTGLKSYPFYRNYFANSWIHMEYVFNSAPTNHGLVNELISSYLEGKITKNYEGTITTPIAGTTLKDSVVNFETDSTGTTVSSGVTTTVVNITKAPNLVLSTGVVGVTDAQLKDAAYLASIGFNIVT